MLLQEDVRIWGTCCALSQAVILGLERKWCFITSKRVSGVVEDGGPLVGPKVLGLRFGVIRFQGLGVRIKLGRGLFSPPDAQLEL